MTSIRLWHITSSPSQTLRRRLVRTTDDGRRGECSTLAAVRCGFVFHTFCTVDNSVDLYAAKPYIRPESRFLSTPRAFDAPIMGVPVGISPFRLVKKIRIYLYSFLTQLTNVTDTQTHTA